MDHASELPQLHVVVVYSPVAGQVDVCELSMPAGATVLQALRMSGLLLRYPGVDLASQKTGVWGKLRGLDDALREGDRVELYRPLQVDPKEARRQRYKQHRERVAKLR